MDPLINNIDIISEIEFVHKSFYNFYKNKNLIPDFCNIFDSLLNKVKQGVDFYEDIIIQKENENKIINKEKKDLSKKGEKIKLLEQEINSLKVNIDKLNIEHNKEKEDYENKIKFLSQKKENVLPTSNNSTENKKNCSQNVNIDKYSKNAKIFVYNSVNNEWQEHIATDTMREIDDAIELKNKIDKEKTTLEEVHKWCMSNTDNSSRTKKYYIRQKIERASEIYKYKDKLKYIDFNLNSIARLSIKHYELWKKDFVELMNSIKIKYRDNDNLNCSQNVIINENKEKEIACIDNFGLGVSAAMVSTTKNNNTIKPKIKCSFDDCNDMVLKKGLCELCKLRTVKEYKNEDGIELWTEPKIGDKYIGIGGGLYIWYGKCIDFEKYNCRDSKTKNSKYCRNHKRKFKEHYNL